MLTKNQARKTKLTVTISSHLAGQIDNLAKERKAPGSRIIEDILRETLQECKKRTIECEIEEYYLSMTEEEKKENREWTMIAAESARRRWDG